MYFSISKLEHLVGGSYGKRLEEVIDNTESTIDIVMFEWRWYENDPGGPMQKVNNALVRAARRGVEVSALVHSAAIAGRLQELGIKAKAPRRRVLVHSKLIIFDRTAIGIGSHNFTNSAMQSNVECSILTESRPAAHDAYLFFKRLWQSSES